MREIDFNDVIVQKLNKVLVSAHITNKKDIEYIQPSVGGGSCHSFIQNNLVYVNKQFILSHYHNHPEYTCYHKIYNIRLRYYTRECKNINNYIANSGLDVLIKYKKLFTAETIDDFSILAVPWFEKTVDIFKDQLPKLIDSNEHYWVFEMPSDAIKVDVDTQLNILSNEQHPLHMVYMAYRKFESTFGELVFDLNSHAHVYFSDKLGKFFMLPDELSVSSRVDQPIIETFHYIEIDGKTYPYQRFNCKIPDDEVYTQFAVFANNLSNLGYYPPSVRPIMQQHVCTRL